MDVDSYRAIDSRPWAYCTRGEGGRDPYSDDRWAERQYLRRRHGRERYDDWWEQQDYAAYQITADRRVAEGRGSAPADIDETGQFRGPHPTHLTVVQGKAGPGCAAVSSEMNHDS